MSLLRGTRFICRLDSRITSITKQNGILTYCNRGLATQRASYDVSQTTKSDATPPTDTFQSLLARCAEKLEDKDAFVSYSENVKHTHKEVKSIAEGYAIGLIIPGRLVVGERFLTCLPDGQDHLYAYLASGRDGVLFYPNPHNIPMSEFLIKLKDAKAKGLLMPETIPNRDYIADLDNAMPEYRSLMNQELFKFPRLPHLRTLFHTGGHMWPGMTSWGTICIRNPVKKSSLVPKLPEVPLSQPILALPQTRTSPNDEYTLSAHTQVSLIQTGVAIAEALKLTPSDRVEMAVPYHVGIVYPVVLGILSKAAVLVQPYYKFQAQYVIDGIVKDKVTVLFIRAADLPSLWERPLAKLDLSSLRSVVVVDGLTANLESQIKTNLKVNEVYGLDFVNDIPGQLVGLIQVGSSGAVPLTFTEAKVVDNSGNVVKVGTSGKLKTKGPHVSTSYGGPAVWVDKDGWLDTRKEATMKSDGSFTIL